MSRNEVPHAFLTFSQWVITFYTFACAVNFAVVWHFLTVLTTSRVWYWTPSAFTSRYSSSYSAKMCISPAYLCPFSESLFIAKISLIKHQLQLKIHVCLENHWSHRIQPGDESELEKNTFWWAGMSELEMSVLVFIRFWNTPFIDKKIDQLL